MRIPLLPIRIEPWMRKKTERIAIRLSQKGCPNRRYYQIVVANMSSRRDYGIIEQLGSYDPMPNRRNEKLVAVNFERLKYWIRKGAEPNYTICHMLGLAGYFDIHPTTLEKAEANRRAAEEAANNETENPEEEISAEIS